MAPARDDEPFRLLVEGVNDYAIYHARSAGLYPHLEHRRATSQAIQRRRSHRQHFSKFYTAEDGDAASRKRAQGRRARGPLRRRRLARAEGRHALLGQRRHHRAARPDGRAARLRQGHARSHRAPRRPRRRCGRARSGSACSSRASSDYAIFMLDPDGHVATWNAGARAHQGLHAPTRSSASTSRSSTRRRTSQPASRERELDDRRARRAASRKRAGACARTARGSGRTSSSPRVRDDRRARSSASPRSRAI